MTKRPQALQLAVPTKGLPREFEGLTQKQVAFVMALFSLADPSYADAAKAAGYKAAREASLRQIGWRNAHDPRVQAAITAEMMRRAEMYGPTALKRVKEIAASNDPREALKAARLLLNFAGLREVSEQRVQVGRVPTLVEQIAEIRRLANVLGISEQEALGNLTDAEEEALLELQKGEDGVYRERAPR